VSSHSTVDASLFSEQGRLVLPRLAGVDYGGQFGAEASVTSLSDDGRTIGGYLTRSTPEFTVENTAVVWRCT
jgi:hypothetical protein